MREKPKNARSILVRPDMLVGDHNIKNYFEIERNLTYFPPFITALLFLNIGIFLWSSFTYIMNPTDNLIIEGNSKKGKRKQLIIISKVNNWIESGRLTEEDLKT